jgi:4-hydroxybenzoate polyprenyltransferase
MTSSRWLAYAQLVRLPNVFTAMADIALAALVTRALPEQTPRFILLLFASTCLYWAGMVLNDYFDLEQDRRERPFRPLPSGRISPRHAAGLALLLLVSGVTLAALVDAAADGWRWRALPTALGLVAAIGLYDAVLKKKWLGPVVMGICRALNVFLGLAVCAESIGASTALLPLLVGIYVGGVTWFARKEARDSNPAELWGAAGTMLAALVLAMALPGLAAEGAQISPLFPYFLVGFGFYVGVPVVGAIRYPTPARVQAAVKRSVLGLILFDSILATALAGTVSILLATLLLPAMILGRKVYST